ncbi:hypothetical protein HIM_06126 [Hirsutella minnesotensis 3608]|uniref:Poly [ADP-ribose] polymerase n=1 Tax=Hirsutella minnesotensis 3608 TaxID=1043627 RepID=A0A0F7ZNX9_9HYPO|nr:hypothetical protein HIM_06126 [Hirsutella minnesotensis 3608]
MPPRKKNTALEGCVVVLSGRFTKYDHSQASLEQLVRSMGGGVGKSAVANMTHVVCTEQDYADGAVKVKAAVARDVPVVKPEWLLECEKQHTALAVDDFLWSGAVSAADGASTKRPAQVSPSSAADDQGAPASEPPVKKRKANGDSGGKDVEAVEAEDKRPAADGQFMKKKGAVIPRDGYCHLTDHEVHVDPDTGMIYDASLNQSSASNNHNKFYRLQILRGPSGAFKTWTRWGRVGEMGQNAVLGDGTLNDAIKHFEKKFKDKSGLPWERRGDDPKPKKYAFVERSYNSDSEDEDEDEDPSPNNGDSKEAETQKAPECTLEKPVQQLMELIFNQSYFQATMSSLNYDADKLPLGKLSKTTITRGFQQLKDLAALLNDPSLALTRWNMPLPDATEHLSNTYYSVIPHAFGRNRPPVIRSNEQLKTEIELLESLSDMKAAADLLKTTSKPSDTIHPLDRQFQSLGMQEVTPLDRSTGEFALLSRYLNESRGSTHSVNYSIMNIFRIERAGEAARFDGSPFARIPSDRRLLWHGSRCTNFGGILSQGLRIAPPEAPVSGYMFGKGIYLADMSSKSAGYCASYNSCGQALLLLCEAELGNPMQQLVYASYSAGEDAASRGMYSTWGMGDMGPSHWMDAGVVNPSLKGIRMPDTTVAPGPTCVPGASLLYNEYICYDVAQVKLRYLFHVQM